MDVRLANRTMVLPLQPNGRLLHVANKPRGREFSLMGTLPLGAQTRGSWTYAYTRQGLKKFDTFSTDFFLNGPLKNSVMTWDNWRDVRDMYHGLEIMRKYPVYSPEHVPDFRIEPLTPRDQRPVINLGSIRVLSTVTEATSPAGGVTEHLAMGEGNVPVRFTMTPEARLELLCHLQSSAYLPTNPTCKAPLIAVVKDTVMEPQLATCDRPHGWADAVRLGFQVMDSKRSGEGEQWDEATGFRIMMPDGTYSMDRMKQKLSPDSMDLSDRALDNHMRGIDLSCARGDATRDPRGELPRLPKWLCYGGITATGNFEPIHSTDAVTLAQSADVANRDRFEGIPAYVGPEYGKCKDLPALRQTRHKRRDDEQRRGNQPGVLPTKRRIQLPLLLPPRKAPVLTQATDDAITIIGSSPENVSASREVSDKDSVIVISQSHVVPKPEPAVVVSPEVKPTLPVTNVSQPETLPPSTMVHQTSSSTKPDSASLNADDDEDGDTMGTEPNESAEACLDVSQQASSMCCNERKCAMVNFFYSKPDGTLDAPLIDLTEPLPRMEVSTHPDGTPLRRSQRIKQGVNNKPASQ